MYSNGNIFEYELLFAIITADFIARIIKIMYADDLCTIEHVKVNRVKVTYLLQSDEGC